MRFSSRVPGSHVEISHLAYQKSPRWVMRLGDLAVILGFDCTRPGAIPARRGSSLTTACRFDVLFLSGARFGAVVS